MEEVVLTAKRRDVIGKQVKALRREGILPAVVFGTGMEATPISLDYRETNKILTQVSASTLVTLDLDGTRHKVLVRERQREPLSGLIRHIDFQAVSMLEKLRVSVPIVLTGEAPAVADFDGIVVLGMETLPVESLPGDLPENITVDISVLKEIGDSVQVKDLVLPNNVSILHDLDDIVVNITSPAPEEIEEEEVEEEEEELEEPEVIERGKREDEDEEKG
jgi:large subunit ribosomal protein L25